MSQPPAIMMSCVAVPFFVSVTARPTRPEWPAILPYMPAARAAAVRRRATVWPLMLPSTRSLSSGAGGRIGRRPDGATLPQQVPLAKGPKWEEVTRVVPSAPMPAQCGG